jgi:HEPN domain-containing protein
LSVKKRKLVTQGKAVARVLREKARSNANRARLVKDLPVAEIGDEAFANDVQQAVEKCLKAAIAWTGSPYPFTHDVGKLIEKVERAGLAMAAVDRDVAESLSAFAAADRYETVRTGPSLDRDAMLLVMELVETWIDTLMAK